MRKLFLILIILCAGCVSEPTITGVDALYRFVDGLARSEAAELAANAPYVKETAEHLAPVGEQCVYELGKPIAPLDLSDFDEIDKLAGEIEAARKSKEAFQSKIRNWMLALGLPGSILAGIWQFLGSRKNRRSLTQVVESVQTAKNTIFKDDASGREKFNAALEEGQKTFVGMRDLIKAIKETIAARKNGTS